jgi:probable HAF family extracellular repeat protein
MIGLGDLPGGAFFSEAWGVSNDGSVVVGNSSTLDGTEAFIWDEENGMRSLEGILTHTYGLELTGWDLWEALSVSADGSVITGYGLNPDGNIEGYLVNMNPVPIPGAIWLFGFGVIGLIGFRKKDGS